MSDDKKLLAELISRVAALDRRVQDLENVTSGLRYNQALRRILAGVPLPGDEELAKVGGKRIS